MKYNRKSPCNNCPYRKDAPLKHWAKEEFIDLSKKDSDEIGSVYACHKKDGHVCVGWLMNQDQRGLPSLALRMDLSRQEVNRKYLDALHSKSQMYGSISEMCINNYPEVFKP